MNIKAEITQDRELIVTVNLPENSGVVDPDISISHFEIYNTRSYIDGVRVFYTDDISLITKPSQIPSVVLSVTESQINVFEDVQRSNGNGMMYPTDLMNDIIIANVTLEYSVSYQASHSCDQMPPVLTVALYHPCNIYGNAILQLGGCNCHDVCEDNLPYGFMYWLLKKKAVDVCLNSMRLDEACRYYEKFFQTDRCNCVKNQNGCGQQYTSSSSSSYSSKKKNCGCHG